MLGVWLVEGYPLTQASLADSIAHPSGGGVATNRFQSARHGYPTPRHPNLGTTKVRSKQKG